MPGKNNGSFGNGSNIKNYLVSRMPDVFRKFELFNLGIDKSIELTVKDFLSLTEKIQLLRSDSGDAVKISFQIAGEMSGDTIFISVKELRGVLVQIKSFIDETNSRFNEGQNELSNVNKTLGDIVDNLSGFKSLVKHLRMLGISTKIESVRLGLEDRGFYTLAEDVEKLSTMITKKSLDIRGKLAYLLNLIINGKTTLTNLMRTQNEFTSKIVEEALKSSDLLLNKYKQAVEKTKLISSKSQEISEGISQAENFIKVHSAVKQPFEQVKSAFTNFAVNSKKKLAVILSSEGSEGTEILSDLEDILKKQISKVMSAENDLDGSLKNIRNNFVIIDDNVSAMLSETQQFINSSSFGQNSLLAEIAKKLTTVSNTIEQDSKISDEMVDSMSSVADTIADLSGFVDEIDEIGTEVELIALNASVKAARTGIEGAALGVLAESIQKLSIDAKNQTALILEVLQNVMKTAEKLRNNFNTKNTDGNKEDLAFLSARINEILNSLKTFDSTIFSKVEGLKEKSLSLSEEIRRISQKLGSDKKVHDLLDLYVNDFQEILNDSLFKKIKENDINFDNSLHSQTGLEKKNIFENANGTNSPDKLQYNNKIKPSGSNELRNSIEFI